MRKIYTSNSLNSIILMVAAILSLAIGALCFLLLFSISDNTSELAALLKKSLFVFLISGISFFVLSRKMRPKESFELSENDITIINHKTKERKQILIKDITNEVSFYSGKMALLHLAFQENDGDEWHIINPKVKKYMELINHFKNLYHKHRTPVVVQQQNNGSSILFRTSSDNLTISQLTHLPHSRLSKYNKNIVVSKTKLLIDNKEFLFNDMQTAVITNDSNIVAFDKNKSEMFVIRYSQITSPDVFLELLKNGLQNAAS